MREESRERVLPVSPDPRDNRKVRRQQTLTALGEGVVGEGGGKERLEGSDEAGQWGRAEGQNKLFPGITAIDTLGTRSSVQALSLWT